MPKKRSKSDMRRRREKRRRQHVAARSCRRPSSDLALGDVSRGARARAVEDVVEGTWALPPGRGGGGVRGVLTHPSARAQSTWTHAIGRPRARSTLSSELEPPALDTSSSVRFERAITDLTSIHTARSLELSGQACQTSDLALTNSGARHRPRA